ncbi:Iron-regulated ABC transporter permease protein SufD [Nitrosospira multiformis ATCC 25196]|uniref:Iron-regulated ABC transporter permease protein SufD n=2 Tax=Nitrosospira multiformis TaxID=1231 RepID=Q2YB66_NITMU|nr:Fe-S cluster assembly protein SufD [Nitrosospira multiformis]ABB74005.1 Iron-regulated ABC transporter permease protein SufD [Nitrosospira multiformis ATCC 25196]SEF54241.1 Iron-regulated ABC transporter permease protein SufD [Nitrosospira multiformis ATCC 25196]
MSMSLVNSNSYLESLLQGQPRLPPSPLAWFNQLRANAVDHAGRLKLPTTRDEEWRFTDLSPLVRHSFQPARAAPALQTADVEHFSLTEAAIRLVFVDGKYMPQLSTPAERLGNRGLIVTNLSSAITANAEAIEPHLGQYARFEGNLFAALNTAFLHDGALVIVPRGAVIDTPVHVLLVTTQPEVASHPRCLFIAEAGSEVTILEDYVSLNEAIYVTNAVTEIAVGDNAQISHIRVQRDSTEAFHIGNCAVSLAHASRYRSVSVALGARISRYDLNTALAAEGAECVIDGLALINGRQLADTHSSIDHARPNCTSRQLHKCIADGSAHAVFNGKIMVRPGAQNTDSAQSSRNLLLNAKARIDTKPQLEIFADDVKCAHGATVGQLDSEELFYLKSRGLSEVAARNLLTYAFGAEIIDRIPIASLKYRLERTVLEQTKKTEP